METDTNSYLADPYGKNTAKASKAAQRNRINHCVDLLCQMPEKDVIDMAQNEFGIKWRSAYNVVQKAKSEAADLFMETPKNVWKKTFLDKLIYIIDHGKSDNAKVRAIEAACRILRLAEPTEVPKIKIVNTYGPAGIDEYTEFVDDPRQLIEEKIA